jgi:hypothetical protein
MAILGVDFFKAKMAGGGARPNLFQVTLNYPSFVAGNTEQAAFMVRAASLPGSTIPEMIVPFRGRQLKVAGDRTFEPWSTTIINDVDFQIRDNIEEWMNGMNEHRNNTGLTNVADYTANLKVEQLDKAGTTIKTYTFIDAFPTVLSPIDLAYDANDQIEEFTCDWSYQYWTSNTTS